MAKEVASTKKVELTKEEKAAAKKARLANKGPRENYVELTSNAENVRVRVQHLRSFGCLVETTLYDGPIDAKGTKAVSVSTNFVTGVKPKTKSGSKFLVVDKGPKPKKEKVTKEEKAAAKPKKK